MAAASMSQRVPSPEAANGRAPGDVLRAARALLVTVLAALVIVAVYVTSVTTTRGQRADERLRRHLLLGSDEGQSLTRLLQDVTVGSIVVVVGSCVVAALARRQWLTAAAAIAVVTGASVTTELLKHAVLTRPGLGWGRSNTFPSGHTTVATSLVLAALLVVPPTARWLASCLGSVAAGVTGIGTVVAGWHRPSDVVAGFAVAMAWGCGALVVLSLQAGKRPQPPAKARPMWLLLGLSVAAGVFLSLGVRPDGTLRDLAVQVLAMGGLALLAAVMVGSYARMVDVRVA